MANYALGKGITKDAILTALKYLGGGAALAGGAELLKTKKDLEKANKAKEIITNEYIDSKNRELALDKALSAARLKDMTRTGAFGTIGGGTLGGLGGYGLTSLVTKNKLIRALGALAGGAAGALGGNYWAYKDYDSKYASQDSNSKNSEVIFSLSLDDALRDARLENEITRAIRRGYGTIGGGLLGGLGGYGLTGLMTKNKLLRALGTLGGGVAGTLGGDYLASKDYSAKHASQNDSNSKFVNNVYNPYKTQNDLLRALVNANDDLNSALKERDFYKNTLGYAAGGTLGGLGGYGLTSLVTKNKLLRALGALAGGAAGAGVNYAYNRGNLDGVLSNGMDKLKANKFIKSIASNPKVQSAINYFKQEK